MERGYVLEVQIFGIHKSAATRKALRFFSERRIKAHFVDVTVRPPSRGELTRFAQKFGAGALVERRGRHFLERGLQHSVFSDDRWLKELVEDPLLLTLPLVRNGGLLTIGDQEDVWKSWIRQSAAESAHRG